MRARWGHSPGQAPETQRTQHTDDTLRSSWFSLETRWPLDIYPWALLHAAVFQNLPSVLRALSGPKSSQAVMDSLVDWHSLLEYGLVREGLVEDGVKVPKVSDVRCSALFWC